MVGRPDFFIIGTPRAGTSALAEFLGRHPGVFMCHPKEPNHFNREVVREARAFLPGNRPFPFTESREEYLSLFRGAGERRAGEATAHYLYSSEAPREIHDFSPGARLVVLFREPVSFLRSLHAQLAFIGVEDELGFGEALALEERRRAGERIPANARYPSQLFYSDRVRYAHHLTRWLAVFDRSAILPLVYDDFRRDNESVYRRVLEFLGLDSSFRPEFRTVNAGKRLRSPGLQRVTSFVASWHRTIHAALPAGLYRRLKGLYDGALKSRKEARADPELDRRLRDRFRPEVAALSDLLDRDLVAEWGYGAASGSARSGMESATSPIRDAS